MSMYFLDETDDWPEYQIVKDEINRLETEYIELGKELEKAESSYKSDPTDESIKAYINQLETKLEEIQKKLEEALSMYR